jgi:hypothetical protein
MRDDRDQAAGIRRLHGLTHAPSRRGGAGRADIAEQIGDRLGDCRSDGARRGRRAFSLGFPRRDGGEEWNARIRVSGRPIADLRHAFGIDEYDLDGRLTGEFHLFGDYKAPFGFGSMTIEEGTAHGEAFERGTAALRFEGRGIRLDGIEMQKGGGTFTGAAFVGWDGTYSFQGDGRRLALEEVALAASTGLPLTGIIAFSADGSGTFRDPIITVEARSRRVPRREGGPGHAG